MGSVMLCRECHLAISYLVLQYVLKLCGRPGSPIALASDQASGFALYVFFCFPFLWRHRLRCCVFMNVLTIFMVEEFYIYAVVQFYFFLQEKSVMYEINQSHLFEK